MSNSCDDNHNTTGTSKIVPLSPYVEKPLNSKVIKSFVPELRSRKCFSSFGIPMFYVYMLWYVMVSGYGTIVGQTGLFNLGITTTPRERKLGFQRKPSVTNTVNMVWFLVLGMKGFLPFPGRLARKRTLLKDWSSNSQTDVAVQHFSRYTTGTTP